MLKEILEKEVKTEDDLKIEELSNQIADCYNKIMLIMLHKMYGVTAELIDDEHICVDGVVMDDEEFADWLIEKEIDLGNIEFPNKQHYDA